MAVSLTEPPAPGILTSLGCPRLPVRRPGPELKQRWREAGSQPMAVEEAAQGRLAFRQRLARLVLDRIAVPAVAFGHLDVDEALLRIKRGVVGALERTGMTRAVVASHLSKSDRWVYKYRQEERRRGSANEREDVEAAEPGRGYLIMAEVVTLFARSHPSALDVATAQEALAEAGWPLDPDDIRARLDLYSEMGLLERDVQDSGQVLYRAHESLVIVPPGADRIEKLAKWLPSVWEIALAYGEEQDGVQFGGIDGELTADAYARFARKVSDGVTAAYADALQESARAFVEGEPLVRINAIIAIGKNLK